MDQGIQIQNENFWSHFYSKHSLRHDPSPFAVWCLESHLHENSRVLELGCGNARDTFAFLRKGLSVVAIDGCEIAIQENMIQLDQWSPSGTGRFFALNFFEITRLHDLCPAELGKINVIYSRFVLHAIPEILENDLLNFGQSILNQGGKMLHEFRTTNDPLMNKGVALSANERVTDHYRRFINAENFRKKAIRHGFREVYFIEAQGLAKFGEDDPVVARVIWEKI